MGKSITELFNADPTAGNLPNLNGNEIMVFDQDPLLIPVVSKGLTFSQFLTYLNDNIEGGGGTYINGEHTASGTLVYPYDSAQAVDYNINGTINTMDTIYTSKSWTMTLVYVDSLLTQLQSTDTITTWTRDITYNPNGTIATDGGWI